MQLGDQEYVKIQCYIDSEIEIGIVQYNRKTKFPGIYKAQHT